MEKCFFAGLIGVVLAGCVTPPPDPNKVAAVPDLVMVFDRLALGLGRDGNPKGRALKWVTPIKVELQDAQNESDRTVVRKAFDVITEITGIPYTFVENAENRDKSNFFVRFVAGKDIFTEVAKLRGGIEKTRALPPQAICYAHPIGKNNIVRAHILITHTMGAEVRDICVLHEMMHAYGLIGHHRKFFPSILYHADMSRQALSVNDGIVLRTLYDSRIYAGMKRDEALPVATKIIADLVRELSTSVAADDVLKQPLKW
jgi:hypothetical protein